MRQALNSYRRQHTLKSRNDENVEDENGKDDDENRESTAIKLGRDLGKRKISRKYLYRYNCSSF